MTFLRKYGKWVLLTVALLLLAGCGQQQPEGKIRDLECSVLDEDEIPQPLADVIEENKSKEMKLSYEKDGYLYITRGFGEQKTGGYSIRENYCYLAEDGVHVQFELLGPPAEETPPEEVTYPYIVVRTEMEGQNIIFE